MNFHTSIAEQYERHYENLTIAEDVRSHLKTLVEALGGPELSGIDVQEKAFITCISTKFQLSGLSVEENANKYSTGDRLVENSLGRLVPDLDKWCTKVKPPIVDFVKAVAAGLNRDFIFEYEVIEDMNLFVIEFVSRSYRRQSYIVKFDI